MSDHTRSRPPMPSAAIANYQAHMHASLCAGVCNHLFCSHDYTQQDWKTSERRIVSNL
jgi:hypothetical protein